MKIIPILRCSDMKESLSFYTTVLDFTIKYPGTTASEPVISLINDGAEIQLSVLDGVFGTTFNLRVHDVDSLFKKYLESGLDISGKEGSPVHQGPTDQSWGLREFYVTDRDGNTLRFGRPIS